MLESINGRMLKQSWGLALTEVDRKRYEIVSV